MENQKKLLTRIRLVNWHYFENELVCLNGSTLLSGENTAGKSTVLDAIQLVLTTNTRRFNTAANEKGSRNLRGYVRCKIGNVGETYLRKNVVIGNIALEFYEEKTGKYFVLGVHMTSPDELSRVVSRWYVEECRLEALSFLKGNKPALAEEFSINGKRLRFIEQKTAARDRFKRRMGNLEDKFFDIIPKSLAFKPMDQVKDFINKFVLSESGIDVESLRVNIETLSELEELIEKSNKKLALLCEIVEKYENIKKKERDILINELLLEKAHVDYLEEEAARLKGEISKNQQYIESNESESKNLNQQIKRSGDRQLELNVSMANNEANKLIEGAQRRIDQLKGDIEKEQLKENKLKSAMTDLRYFLGTLQKLNRKTISKQELEILSGIDEPKKKVNIMQKLSAETMKHMEEIRLEDTKLQLSMETLNKEIEALQLRLRELENRKLTYPWYTRELKLAVEKEFKRRNINSNVYVAAELLEITDSVWQNAIEGYFNTQKFNLIVEPDYYNVALEIYHKNRQRIHTAGIVNTRKLKPDNEINNQSLAYVVHSENRYAKAYANFVLGRVIRCETMKALENHPIAITAEGMLYQGYVVRNLDKDSYKDPFIGQNAYRVQIENTKKELEEKSGIRKQLREDKQKYSHILEAERKVNLDLLSTYLDAPLLKKQYETKLSEATDELREAKKDPTLIELMTMIDEVTKEKTKYEEQKTKLIGEIGRLKAKNEQYEQQQQNTLRELETQKSALEKKADEHGSCMSEAEEKYRLNRKTKAPKTIEENFTPKKTQFINEREDLLNGNGGLRELQDSFNHTFDQDFLRGMEGIRDYIDAKQQLQSVELIRFDEQLRKAKEDCEEIFKSDFLAKMKENIENARNEFKSLNKALNNIYYGDDSYRFVLTYEKKKESLYRMITSENNFEGYNLWTQAFEEEYKEEMEELFDKLTAKDDKGEKVIEEYTDYRSYLDYDIEIHKRDGSVQKFSAIYGEKSGSETQVPYYVAIAASFYQLYRLGNSVRLMLLDEAFDKMDDERIASMMEFFNGLDLQVIMATPPAKVEIIGEKVDTILTAIRVGSRSIIEEYDL